MTTKHAIYAGETERIPIDHLHAHMDPFYNECRAFGRLTEQKLNRKYAVRRYGYTAISPGRELEIEREFHVDFGRSDDEYELPVSKSQPLRAIIKELIRDHLPLAEKALGKILRDLKKTRAEGVYPMDVVRQNYKGGKLLDMSVAMTKPHYLFDIRPKWQVELYQLEDLLDFDKMVEDEGIVNCRRAVRNVDYYTKLQSQKRKVD